MPPLRLPLHLSLILKRLPAHHIRPPLRLHLRLHATAPSPSPRTPLIRLLGPHGRLILLALGNLLTWVPAPIFCWAHIFQIATVTGPSMYPFLNTSYNTSTTKDRVWMNMWNPYKDLKRGMVVSFWSPRNPEVLAVKRIVAMEGDRVKTRGRYPLEYEDVPVGHVWVEGDNSEKSGEESHDSNFYGPVSKSLIVGRLVGVVWPLRRRRWIRWEDWKGSERVMEGVNNIENAEFY